MQFENLIRILKSVWALLLASSIIHMYFSNCIIGGALDKSGPTAIPKRPVGVWITHIVTWPVPGHRTSSVQCFTHVFSACLVYDVVALPE
jgi:hypothetical protein